MTCQVQATAKKLLKLSAATESNMHRLRAELHLCRECNLGPECAFMQEYQAAFKIALERITKEWNLQKPR